MEDAQTDIDDELLIEASSMHCRKVSRIRQLLGEGANVNAQDMRGWTSLHWASLLGPLEVAELLIEFGADVHARDNDGKTPLHAACWAGGLKVVQLLMNQGANLSAETTQGSTPLHLAAERNRIHIVWFLVRQYYPSSVVPTSIRGMVMERHHPTDHVGQVVERWCSFF